MKLTPSLLRNAADLIATPSRFCISHHAATLDGAITLPGSGDARAWSAIGAICELYGQRGQGPVNVAEALRAWQDTGFPCLVGAGFLQSVYYLRRCAWVIESQTRATEEEWRLAA